jgi:hypothetical protein
LVAADGRELGEDAIPGDTVARQEAPCPRLALGERDQQVLDRDVLVLQPGGLPLGRLQDARQGLRDRDLARGRRRAGRPRLARQRGLEVLAQPGHLGAHPGEQARHEPLGLFQQGEQQVLAVDLRVAGPGRDVLGGGQCLL